VLDSHVPTNSRPLDPETRFFPVRAPGPCDALTYAPSGQGSRFRGTLGKPATNTPYRDDATSRHKNKIHHVRDKIRCKIVAIQFLSSRNDIYRPAF